MNQKVNLATGWLFLFEVAIRKGQVCVETAFCKEKQMVKTVCWI